jgi:hypothetical protein
VLILLQSLFSTAISQSFHDAGTVVDAALRPVPGWRPITADVAATEIPERVAARPCPLPRAFPWPPQASNLARARFRDDL